MVWPIYGKFVNYLPPRERPPRYKNNASSKKFCKKKPPRISAMFFTLLGPPPQTVTCLPKESELSSVIIRLILPKSKLKANMKFPEEAHCSPLTTYGNILETFFYKML